MDVFELRRRLIYNYASYVRGFLQVRDPEIDRQITRARALQASDPALASSLWSKIDHELVDQAPVVPLVNPKQVDFLSQRAGNYQYNPQWGVLLDQLWVR